MNYYFLLEDEKSLLKVLPKWLDYLSMPVSRVADIGAIDRNNYILQSGQGVTQLVTKVIFDTIDTILESDKQIDWLVIVLDSEEHDADYRKAQVEKIISDYAAENNYNYTFQIKILVCEHCFETWLLGNEDIYPMQEPLPSEEFSKFYLHYNIAQQDPELMPVPAGTNSTIAKYHFQYLHEALRYKKVRYRKSRPDNIATREYFENILHRVEHTSHLKTFKELIEFIVGNE